MKRRQSIRVLFFATLCLSAAVAALSQTAQITERITDQAGAIVPGANIIATNAATGINREAISKKAPEQEPFSF